MYPRNLLRLALLSSSAFLACNVMAADAGTTTTQMQTAPAPAGSTDNPLMPGPQSVGGSERMDNTNAAPLDAWIDDYAAAHQGRIDREVLLDQMGHRWDAIDAQRRGYLTPEEARGIYLPRQTVRPARSGSDVAPGYMGPGSTKGD